MGISLSLFHGVSLSETGFADIFEMFSNKYGNLLVNLCQSHQDQHNLANPNENTDYQRNRKFS